MSYDVKDQRILLTFLNVVHFDELSEENNLATIVFVFFLSFCLRVFMLAL